MLSSLSPRVVSTHRVTQNYIIIVNYDSFYSVWVVFEDKQ